MWRRQMEKRFAIDDSALVGMLRAGIDEKHELTLLRSDRPMTDRRPLSIFSVQTARKLAEETARLSTSDGSGQTSIWI